jgi:cholesterol 25-hydroxylase
VILELVAALLIYDTLFFVAHLALHNIPVLAKFHAPHHRHGEINPQITNQLDIVERLTLVLLANFSLNIIGSHVLTRTLFVPVFVWLLVEIHSGLDLELGYDKLLPAGWGAGSKRHAVHHRGGKEYFEPYFCWWDNLLVKIQGGPDGRREVKNAIGSEPSEVAR